MRCLVGVVNTHWSTIGLLDAKSQIPATEKLIHRTTKNPSPRYQYFNRRFFKFPSYYRRGAIQFAIGQVSSFNTRYREWQSGKRARKDALPPRLNANCGTYPPLYKGQCIKFTENNNGAAIKVFSGTDWIWTTVGVTGHRERHLNPNNQRKSPYLIVNGKGCYLSVPFQIKIPKLKDTELVLSCDLGINTTTTVSIVNFDGSVKYIVFEHLKGWRPKGGKKRSTLKQRFHGWLHRRIVNLTEMKWSELGGKVIFVNPRGTSSYAYDGSGKLNRNNQNYALAQFASSKLYNADLSASYNIGARDILKLCGGNSPENLQGKSSCKLLRSPVTLSVLWRLPPSNIVEQDTQSSRSSGLRDFIYNFKLRLGVEMVFLRLVPELKVRLELE